MAEKKNESKFLSILERTGVIRKSEADAPKPRPNPAKSGRPAPRSADGKPIFDAPRPSPAARPATRQPVPGMSTRPVAPSDVQAQVKADLGVAPRAEAPVIDTKKLEQEYRQALTIDTALEAAPAVGATVAPPPVVVAPVVEEPVITPPVVVIPVEETVVEEAVVELPVVEEPVAPASEPARAMFANLERFEEDYAQEGSALEVSEVEVTLPLETYTDRFLNTDELYDALALKANKTDSIYLIEDYLNTIPDSLPDTSRREIVSKLLAASGFDYDLLMGDGVLRVKMLKEYAERFAQHTDDYIAGLQAHVDELNQQIMHAQQLVDKRKELHKKQFFSIEAEAQRLKEILAFISE